MSSTLQAVFLPPLAICRHGCAAVCAAPIGLFYITALVAMVYSLFGGPAAVPGISWATLGLGVLLWVIAATWSLLVLRGPGTANAEQASVCASMWPANEERHPLEKTR